MLDHSDTAAEELELDAIITNLLPHDDPPPFDLVDSELIYELANARGAAAARPRWTWHGSIQEDLIWTANFPWVPDDLEQFWFEIRPAGPGLWSLARRRYGTTGPWTILACDAPLAFVDPKVAKILAQLCSPPLLIRDDCLHWVPTGAGLEPVESPVRQKEN